MANIALVIVILALSILDVTLTKAGWKAGAVEKNPVMRWLQFQLPTGWQYIRPGAALVIALTLCLFPFPISTLGLGIIAMIYALVDKSNYDLAKQP